MDVWDGFPRGIFFPFVENWKLSKLLTMDCSLVFTLTCFSMWTLAFLYKCYEGNVTRNSPVTFCASHWAGSYFGTLRPLLKSGDRDPLWNWRLRVIMRSVVFIQYYMFYAWPLTFTGRSHYRQKILMILHKNLTNWPKCTVDIKVEIE